MYTRIGQISKHRKRKPSFSLSEKKVTNKDRWKAKMSLVELD